MDQKPPKPEGAERTRPVKSAKARALAWLSRREYSTKELELRLQSFDYSTEEIRQTLEWVQSLAFQSDERFAQSLARRRSTTYGSRFIRAELKQHAIEGQNAVEALAQLNQEQGSEEDRAYAWLERRFVRLEPTRENQAKAMRSLAARGFESDAIRSAVKRWVQGDDAL